MADARQRAREQAIARVTARATQAESVQRMWLTFYDEILVPQGMTVDDPEMVSGVLWLRRAFYSGAASMFDLVTRIAPKDMTEDYAAAMLQRLHDEFTIYARGLSANGQVD